MDLERLAANARLGDVGRLSPTWRRLLGGVLGAWIRLAHRPRMDGFENVPASGPFLVVANHSGGGTAEVAVLAYLWHEKFGVERPITGMAHPLVFYVWPGSAVVRGLGAIPSTYDAALRALASGVPVLVFPGGDHEAFRPIWQAYRVDLGGRMGFLRLARRAWVPVVPLGIRGSHFSAPILWRSRLLPWLLGIRLFGVKRAPITLLGVAGLALAPLLAPKIGIVAAVALAALLFASPLTILPWNFLVPIRARMGEPIPPEELFRSRDEDAPLDDALARVQGEVQKLVVSPAARMA